MNIGTHAVPSDNISTSIELWFSVNELVSVHAIKAFIARFPCERLSVQCALDPTIPHSVSFVWVYSPCPYILERVKPTRTSVVIPPLREVVRLTIRSSGP